MAGNLDRGLTFIDVVNYEIAGFLFLLIKILMTNKKVAIYRMRMKVTRQSHKTNLKSMLMRKFKMICHINKMQPLSVVRNNENPVIIGQLHLMKPRVSRFSQFPSLNSLETFDIINDNE